jgi:hypothetical protein
MPVTVPAHPLVRHAVRHRTTVGATLIALAAGCVVHGLPAQGWTSAGRLVVVLVLVVLVPAVWGTPERREAALAVLDRLLRWRCEHLLRDAPARPAWQGSRSTCCCTAG